MNKNKRENGQLGREENKVRNKPDWQGSFPAALFISCERYFHPMGEKKLSAKV
jgi:hypothetical protein